MIRLFPILLLAGCAELYGHHYHNTTNLKREIIEVDWIPVEPGPEPVGKPADDVKHDSSRGDPGFICLEPVTPASIQHDWTAKVSGKGIGSAEGGDTTSLGKIYDLSDVVLLAQTQAYQMCLARMSGEMTNVEYLKSLEAIRESTVRLVQAQNENAAAPAFLTYRDLIALQVSCMNDAKGDPAALAICAEYGKGASAALASIASIPAPTGGMCARNTDCASNVCEPTTKACK